MNTKNSKGESTELNHLFSSKPFNWLPHKFKNTEKLEEVLRHLSPRWDVDSSSDKGKKAARSLQDAWRYRDSWDDRYKGANRRRVERLRAHGFTPVVRQAGGLAVVSNEGILNINLLFKNKQMPTLTSLRMDAAAHSETFPRSGSPWWNRSFWSGGLLLPRRLRQAFKDRKIAGIAQHRLKRYLSVFSIYPSVYGDQYRRGPCCSISMTTQSREEAMAFPRSQRR